MKSEVTQWVYVEKDGHLYMKELEDGEPCKHPGCLSHITHPCEGCGRIGGYNIDYPTKKFLEN